MTSISHAVQLRSIAAPQGSHEFNVTRAESGRLSGLASRCVPLGLFRLSCNGAATLGLCGEISARCAGTSVKGSVNQGGVRATKAQCDRGLLQEVASAQHCWCSKEAMVFEHFRDEKRLRHWIGG